MARLGIYHPRLISEGVEEESQIFLRDVHFYQNGLTMRNTAVVTGSKTIAGRLQSTSGGNAVNSLVAFYDIHGRKTDAILLFCPGHNTRLINLNIFYIGF
jgi:hypothetical protein